MEVEITNSGDQKNYMRAPVFEAVLQFLYGIYRIQMKI